MRNDQPAPPLSMKYCSIILSHGVLYGFGRNDYSRGQGMIGQ